MDFSVAFQAMCLQKRRRTAEVLWSSLARVAVAPRPGLWFVRCVAAFPSVIAVHTPGDYFIKAECTCCFLAL